MSNKGWLIGCGTATAVAVLLCGGVAYLGWYAVQGAGEFFGAVVEAQLDAERQRQRIASEWQPPAADAASEALFPQQVAGHGLVSIEPQAALPELGVDSIGHHAVYESTADRVEVYMFPMNRQQADTVFAGAKQIMDAEGPSGIRSWSSVSTSDDFAHAHLTTSQLGNNELWFIKDWLLIVRTDGDSAAGEAFIHAFLHQGSLDEDPRAAEEPEHHHEEHEDPSERRRS